MKADLIERFCTYVKIDTQSDPNSNTFPSSEKQKNLSNLLVKELHEMNFSNAQIDENGYVYCTIEASKDYANSSTILFCSHVDTAPDCSGTDVKPIVHYNYDGKDIILPDDNSQILSVSNNPYLSTLIGNDIITASGNTLLGADDKSGVAIIMQLAKFYSQNPEYPHSKIQILFTPDEEVGQGVDKVNIDKLDCEFGYTLDSGVRGALECENFSADSITVDFFGVSEHPGYAKGKLVNSIKVASYFIDLLKKDTLSPETTSGNDGFIHPVQIEGTLEKTTVKFILRTFDTFQLAEYASIIESNAIEAIKLFPKSRYKISQKEQYRNMFEIIKNNTKVVTLGEQAIKNVGLDLKRKKIRGGTDGARLSFLGIPCPNLFTGEMAIHSKLEYVSVQDMLYSIEVCKEIAKLNN